MLIVIYTITLEKLRMNRDLPLGLIIYLYRICMPDQGCNQVSIKDYSKSLSQEYAIKFPNKETIQVLLVTEDTRENSTNGSGPMLCKCGYRSCFFTFPRNLSIAKKHKDQLWSHVEINIVR